MTGEPTVFVVDDDPSVLRAIARLLRLEFAVEAFDSPSAFLESMRPDAPGCILLDLALPGVPASSSRSGSSHPAACNPSCS